MRMAPAITTAWASSGRPGRRSPPPPNPRRHCFPPLGNDKARVLNHAILQRVAEINKTLLVHDSALRDLYQKLLEFLQPPPESPRRSIGFKSASDI